MNITDANKTDLPEMIALLKQSLGESLIPKSEEYFLWKHMQNPFGASRILLAKENEKIIGLRAFMRWSWATQETNISAVRAVDTATDPAFQGKGIFKKLTLQAVEECKQEGTAMVFNSPNAISMQGYLKMGWVPAGRMPVYLGPGVLFPRFYSESICNHFYNEYSIKDALQKLDASWALPVTGNILYTAINFNYLKWRYQDCPVVKYAAVIEPGKFGFVFRLKKIKWFTELRVCDIWIESSASEDLVNTSLKNVIKKIRPALVSCAPSPAFPKNKKKLLNLSGPFLKGPLITIRTLAIDNLNNFEQFNQWQPSMGSMELF